MTSLPIIGYNVIMTTNWFGVVGRNGSGKSTVCEYLVSKGYQVYSLSDVVRQYATQAGLVHDRDTLTSLANQLKTDHGTDFFAQSVVQSAKGQALVVFDSIRHPSEIAYLRSHHVQFIGVECSLKDCYDRIVRRGKTTDFVSFEDFKRQDEYEMNGNSFGQLISECLALCDQTIHNNGDLRNLYDALDDMLVDMGASNVK